MTPSITKGLPKISDDAHIQYECILHNTVPSFVAPVKRQPLVLICIQAFPVNYIKNY